ncbi:MAG TPA: sigma-70 family RNA polymerase sigma factor [Thermoanaerobaculia bacterium]|jgi:RNA polymerase sigma factor for flagellar operon FliA|nr:sigma-70 family RNA polymerase sigma factor [Thermoanaerobaculia bacterium]
MATLPTPSGDDLTAEQLFLGHLKLVKQIVAFGCRRSKFSPQDAEDFQGTVMIKLIEDDYAVLRLFEGRSEIRTYLTVVINRLLLDFQNHLWTKWRSSAEAGRMGPIAERLEKLMVRDKLSFAEACHILQGEGVEMTEGELEEIRAKLPPRFTRTFVAEETLQTIVSRWVRPDEAVERKEQRALAMRVLRVLFREIDNLSAEDRLLVKMRSELKVADIARHRHLDQKGLYRRLNKIYERLRTALERQGIRKNDVTDLLGDLQPGFLDL